MSYGIDSVLPDLVGQHFPIGLEVLLLGVRE